jgi:hypothetical protein
MKTRQGFVSNSSTTSFCIYGICVSSSEIKEFLKLEDEERDLYGALEEAMKEKKVSLYFQANYDGDEYYIGQEFSSIGDEETGKEFKKRTMEDVNTLFDGQIEEKKFGVCEEAWRDG